MFKYELSTEPVSKELETSDNATIKDLREKGWIQTCPTSQKDGLLLDLVRDILCQGKSLSLSKNADVLYDFLLSIFNKITAKFKKEFEKSKSDKALLDYAKKTLATWVEANADIAGLTDKQKARVKNILQALFEKYLRKKFLGSDEPLCEELRANEKMLGAFKNIALDESDQKEKRDIYEKHLIAILGNKEISDNLFSSYTQMPGYLFTRVYANSSIFLNADEHKTSNIYKENDGEIYLTIHIPKLIFRNPTLKWPGEPEELEFPGKLFTKYKMVNNGFKLLTIGATNKILFDLAFDESLFHEKKSDLNQAFEKLKELAVSAKREESASKETDTIVKVLSLNTETQNNFHGNDTRLDNAQARDSSHDNTKPNNASKNLADISNVEFDHLLTTTQKQPAINSQFLNISFRYDQDKMASLKDAGYLFLLACYGETAKLKLQAYLKLAYLRDSSAKAYLKKLLPDDKTIPAELGKLALSMLKHGRISLQDCLKYDASPKWQTFVVTFVLDHYAQFQTTLQKDPTLIAVATATSKPENKPSLLARIFNTRSNRRYEQAKRIVAAHIALQQATALARILDTKSHRRHEQTKKTVAVHAALQLVPQQSALSVNTTDNGVAAKPAAVAGSFAKMLALFNRIFNSISHKRDKQQDTQVIEETPEPARPVANFSPHAMRKLGSSSSLGSLQTPKGTKRAAVSSTSGLPDRAADSSSDSESEFENSETESIGAPESDNEASQGSSYKSNSSYVSFAAASREKAGKSAVLQEHTSTMNPEATTKINSPEIH